MKVKTLSSVLLLLSLLQLTLQVRIPTLSDHPARSREPRRSPYDNDISDFDDDNESPTVTEYVDNEVCIREGFVCGGDNRTLRTTRCCQVRDRRTGIILMYQCCNPELAG